MSSNYDPEISVIQEIAQEIYRKKDEIKRINSEIKELDSEIQGILTDFFSLAEASERLQISPQAVQRGIRANRYEGVNYAGKWYVKANRIREEAELNHRMNRGVI